jgi:hypothetical protein
MLKIEQHNIDPAVAELDFERLEWKIENDPFKPELSIQEIVAAVGQYRRFLSLKRKYPGVSLVPTDDIDMVWHAHILDTQNYATDCENLFGEFLHHNPFFGAHGDETQEEMAIHFEETSTLWQSEYGEPLDTPDVFRCKGKACHSPKNCRCR